MNASRRPTLFEQWWKNTANQRQEKAWLSPSDALSVFIAVGQALRAPDQTTPHAAALMKTPDAHYWLNGLAYHASTHQFQTIQNEILSNRDAIEVVSSKLSVYPHVNEMTTEERKQFFATCYMQPQHYSDGISQTLSAQEALEDIHFQIEAVKKMAGHEAQRITQPGLYDIDPGEAKYMSRLIHI